MFLNLHLTPMNHLTDIMARHAITLLLIALLGLLPAWSAPPMALDQLRAMDNRQLMERARQFVNNHTDSAAMCYIIVANRINNKQSNEDLRCCIEATFCLSDIYQYYYYNYQKAIECLLRAQHETQRLADSTLMSHIESHLGSLYLQFEHDTPETDKNNLQQTMEHYRNSYRYANTDELLQTAAFNLVSVGVWSGQIDQTYTELCDYFNRMPTDHVKDYFQAAVSMHNGQHEDAISAIDRALQTLVNDKSRNWVRRICVMRLIKSQWLESMGRDRESLDELAAYEQSVRSNGLLEGIPDIYQQYYEFYHKRGREDLAKDYKLKYYMMVDSLDQMTKLPYMHKAQSLFDLQQMNEEARIRENENNQMRQILLWVSLAALLFLLLLIIIYYHAQQLRAKNRALYEQSLAQLDIINENRRAMELANVKELELSIPPYQEADDEDNTEKFEVDRQTLEGIWLRVKSVFENRAEIYEESFTLNTLCIMVNTNSKYISQAINTFSNGNFKSLLNQARIREACRRMNDMEHYGNYTIESIGKSVGMTRTSFVNHFKQQTGLTPSAYLKLTREQSSRHE